MTQPTRTAVFRLPPFKVESVLRADELSEIVDWSLTAYHIPDEWKTSQGQGIKIGLLDTGVDQTHPDLAEAIDQLQDFTHSAFGTSDRVGHGTHTAGTIAARKNGRGIVGVAPQCRLLVGKVLGDDGSGNDQSVAAGIDWAVQAGADVISMSLGSPVPSPTILASLQAATAAGTFVICAAGNDGRGATDDGSQDEVDYPGRWDHSIAVAAVDEQGQLAPFSSRGPEVCVAAPGVNILSTFLNGGYARLSGTSMATPFVTGVVALLLAARRQTAPNAGPQTVADLRQLLSATATHEGPAGHNNEYGWGLINPGALLTARGATAVPMPTQPSAIKLGPLTIHMPALATDRASVSW